MRTYPAIFLFSAAVCLRGWIAPAAAQTGPELMLRPFRPSDQLELNADAIYQFRTESSNRGMDGSAFNYRAEIFDVSGRLRLAPGTSERGIARAQPRAGFQSRYIRLHTDDPTLPDEMFDASLAVGMGVLSYEGWLGALSVGVGHAGAEFEEDANGLYFQGDFAVGRTFRNGDALGVVIDYNGNRTFLPDWPLPGFQYRKRLDRPRPAPRVPEGEGPVPPGVEGYDPEADPPRLVLALGFPFLGVEWRPTDRFRTELTFTIPDNLNLRADYRLLGTDEEDTGLGVYASLSRLNTAVHWNELERGHDRLIFRQNLAEAGLNWRLNDRLELVLSGGWSFNQEFLVGFDSRDADEVAEIEDGPFVRGQVRVRL